MNIGLYWKDVISYLDEIQLSLQYTLWNPNNSNIICKLIPIEMNK